MATIVTRSGKGSALTFVEADANFTNLNQSKLELTDLSVGTEASASGDGAIAYNNTTGVFTYTPPTAAGIGAATAAQGSLADSALQNISEDTTPQLSANLDTQGYSITTSVTDGNLILAANGTGNVSVNSDLKTNGVITAAPDTDINISPVGTGGVLVNGPLYLQNSITEYITADAVTSGTWAIDPADGTIQVITLTGNITITGFSNPIPGTSVSIVFDGTGGSYTLSFSTATFMAPGGTLALTDGGLDVVTITCLDPTPSAEVYTAFIANNFAPL